MRLRDPSQESSVFLSSPLNGAKMYRRDLDCSLHEFEGVNEKFCSCHLRGKKSDFSNILLCTNYFLKRFLSLSKYSEVRVQCFLKK